uniref:Prothymosin alpha n=2 Tax=Sus scrofa TaxID=9823 RepID=A0A8D1MLW3_PIG
MSEAQAVGTSSEITTKDLQEKKEVVEEAKNEREAHSDGNARVEMELQSLASTTATWDSSHVFTYTTAHGSAGSLTH